MTDQTDAELAKWCDLDHDLPPGTTKTYVHPENSYIHEESYVSAPNSHVQVVKLDPSDKLDRSLRWFFPAITIMGLALASSMAVNIYCLNVIRDDGTEQRLKQYNLDWFKSHEFADLRGQVALDEKLITAFGPQSCRR